MDVNDYVRYHSALKQQKKRSHILFGAFAVVLLAVLIAIPVVIISGINGDAEDDYEGQTLNEELVSQASVTSEAPEKVQPVGSALDWNLILVNKWNYLPDDFNVELEELPNGEEVDARIIDDLKEMLSDAESEGLSPIICSSYRSLETQTGLFENKVNEYMAEGKNRKEAEKEASMWVAIPGTSEHHTGLAVDIVALSYQLLDEAQEDTAEQKWLIENSYKYGFILRYPNGKTDKTGILYEPWHYRYVGKEAARIIFESGITFEEYIERLG